MVPVLVKEGLVPDWLMVKPALTVMVPSLLSCAEALAMVRGWLTVIVPPAWLSSCAARVRAPPWVPTLEVIEPALARVPELTVSVSLK